MPMRCEMKSEEVPLDFPDDQIPAVVAGAQPKVCVRSSGGRYVAGQSSEERYHRWEVCEDLAQQLVRVATREAAMRPSQSHEKTLQRVLVAVARKGWISPGELVWVICRLRVLLRW
ncbi:hypothetical protein QF001_001768 [Paraburkholderia youngii]